MFVLKGFSTIYNRIYLCSNLSRACGYVENTFLGPCRGNIWGEAYSSPPRGWVEGREFIPSASVDKKWVKKGKFTHFLDMGGISVNEPNYGGARRVCQSKLERVFNKSGLFSTVFHELSTVLGIFDKFHSRYQSTEKSCFCTFLSESWRYFNRQSGFCSNCGESRGRSRGPS